MRREKACLGLVLACACLLGAPFDAGDDLLARGEAEAAYRAYAALDSRQVEADGLLFRLAECEHSLSNRQAYALTKYRLILRKYPKSGYVPRARFRLAEAQCRAESADERRRGIAAMLELAFGRSPLAAEACGVAATACYADGRYAESLKLAERGLSLRSRGATADALRSLARWSAYLAGDSAALARLCADATDEESAYLVAAGAFADGKTDLARAQFAAYLSAYPYGRYRPLAEPALARLRLDAAAAAERSGRLAEARAEYARLEAELGPGEVAGEAQFRQAMACLAANDWRAAQTLLSACLAYLPPGRQPEALYWRGVAYWKLGGADGACARLFRTAIRLGLRPELAREAQTFLDHFEAERKAPPNAEP